MAKKSKPTNYEAACAKLGFARKEAPASETYPGELHDHHAHVLRVCVAAENAEKQADGSFKTRLPKKDGTERTYTPWFYKSGSGWVYGYCDDWCTRTCVGPRLEYFDLTVMKAAVKKLATEYNNYFNS